tara:strand:+ start:1294 stop:1680 length:387 start_codon:yes stop_codon:yes gene_type:complete
MQNHNVTQTGTTILDKIADFIVPQPLLGFLNTKLYENYFMYFNNWSFVHFFSGVIFYFLFPKMEFKKKLIIWTITNIIYEIIEFILALGGHPLFVEEFVDIIWDLIFSISGLIVMWKIMKISKNKKLN